MESNFFNIYNEISISALRQSYAAGTRNFALVCLSEVDLSRENLSGANLNAADLSGTYLNHANLSNADLRYTNLFGADLSSSDLRGANLKDSNLFWTNVASALYDERTQFPLGFSPRLHRMIFLPSQNLNLVTAKQQICRQRQRLEQLYTL